LQYFENNFTAGLPGMLLFATPKSTDLL